MRARLHSSWTDKFDWILSTFKNGAFVRVRANFDLPFLGWVRSLVISPRLACLRTVGPVRPVSFCALQRPGPPSAVQSVLRPGIARGVHAPLR